jgi:hypothetical protein
MKKSDFEVLNALGRGSNCRDGSHVKGLWLIGTNFYFLEYTTAEKESGMFCFDLEQWDWSNSPLAPYCTQVPGSGDMAIAYIPSGIKRITSENVIERVKSLFGRSSEETRLLASPANLHHSAYYRNNQLWLGMSPIIERRLVYQ